MKERPNVWRAALIAPLSVLLLTVGLTTLLGLVLPGEGGMRHGLRVGSALALYTTPTAYLATFLVGPAYVALAGRPGREIRRWHLLALGAGAGIVAETLWMIGLSWEYFSWWDVGDLVVTWILGAPIGLGAAACFHALLGSRRLGRGNIRGDGSTPPGRVPQGARGLPGRR